ncbi:MAG: hypothetical protein JSV88_25025, partial [Candidatus Aminicenantes bacterium]
EELKRLFSSGAGWTELQKKSNPFAPVKFYSGPGLVVPTKENPEANVRVSCKDLYFKLEWPKIDKPNEKWTWEADFMVAIEANLGLIDKEGDQYLQIQPTKIKITPINGATGVLAPKKAGSEQDGDECEKKFEQLIAITVEIVSVEYGPALVQNIEIPVLNIGEKPVYPVFMDLSDHMVTVGTSLDRANLAEKISYQFDKMFTRFQVLLQQDIEENGGLEKMILKPQRSKSDIQFQKPEKIDAKFKCVNAFIKRLEQEVAELARNPPVKSRTVEVVPKGIGAAVNGYFLQSLLAFVMPTPVNDCTDWVNLLEAVRGRICYGISIDQPRVAIDGTSLTGGANVDLGGAVEACIRKFWDCSWRWSCGSLALSLKGDPKITLILSTGEKGVVMIGQFDFSRLQLDSNLPDPFNLVVNGLGLLVIKAIEAIINIVLTMIPVTIIVPAIEIPDQKTKIYLQDFTPFPFIREDSSLPQQRRTFLGYEVSVRAGE